MVEVIDNFLDKEYFNKIKNFILSEEFPWYYNDRISNKNDPKDFYYFTHAFYTENSENSSAYNIWEKFLKKIDCKALIRIKASMYNNINKKRKNKPHVDYPYSHKGCLFYLNSNNGETYFKNKKVLPKENRAVFFDPSIPHSSSLCTDEKRRITINFNYF
jgi:hypothetical protein